MVRLVFALSAGIWFARYAPTSVTWALTANAILVVAYAWVFLKRNKWNKRPFCDLALGLLGLSGVFALGYFRSLTVDKRLDPLHIYHHIDSIEGYEAVLLKDVVGKKSQDSYCRATVDVLHIREQAQWWPAKGRVVVTLLNGPEAIPLFFGQKVLIMGSPNAVTSPLNPGEFDRAAFLSRLQIYHQHRVDAQALYVLESEPVRWFFDRWTVQALRYSKRMVDTYVTHPEARSVIMALVLGQKQYLSKTTRDAYAQSGTMHTLAVSGLHVGILYAILNFLCSRFVFGWRLVGTRWTAILPLAGVWFYALMTGCAASVLRAAWMLSFALVGRRMGRSPQIHNTLAGAAFCMLVLNPLLVADIGFQLSYAAVFGILLLQRHIASWWLPRNGLLRFFWKATTITLAAQIATAPLSLYHFKQLPRYFIITNWIAIPTAAIVMGGSLLLFALGPWHFLAQWVGWALTQAVLLMNKCMLFFQQLPYSTFEVAHVRLGEMLGWYVVLALLLVACKVRRMGSVVGVGAAYLALVLHGIMYCLGQSRQCKMIFYGIPKHRAVAFVKGRHSTVCTDDRLWQRRNDRSTHCIASHQRSMGVKNIEWCSFSTVAQETDLPVRQEKGVVVACWNGQTVIFLDKKCRDALQQLHVSTPIDFVVLEDDVVTQLNELPDLHRYKRVIIGGSNTNGCVESLKKDSERLGMSCHVLSEDGAMLC